MTTLRDRMHETVDSSHTDLATLVERSRRRAPRCGAAAGWRPPAGSPAVSQFSVPVPWQARTAAR